MTRQQLEIEAHGVTLNATLELPSGAAALVLLVHGCGESRGGERNRQIAATLRRAGIATLLLDLLTPEEEDSDRHMGHLRFNVGLFAQRIVQATECVIAGGDACATSVGYFGSGTGAAAALIAAARQDERVSAVVALGGRPDLAGAYLELVTAPSLLIVGERDAHVLEINREAYARMRCTRELAVIPRASHHFEEQGTLEMASELAVAWFFSHFSEGDYTRARTWPDEPLPAPLSRPA